MDTGAVLGELLRHEMHYWQGRAREAGLFGGRDGLSMGRLSQVAAAGCLLGVSTAAELGRRVPGAAVTDAEALWLRELYPPGPDGELGVLRPDRLAELHVSRELGNSPELARACLTGLDPVQARRALVLLARASGEHPAARSLLESSLARFADVAEGLTAPREVMVAIADAIPYPSLALAPAHANITRQILATYPPGTTQDRARWLNTLAVLLGDLGRREDALAAIEEAVTSYRELAASRPDAFLPNLAASLNNQSTCLSDLGRREQALAAIEEAVTIRRALAGLRPAVFASRYANSLDVKAQILSALGRAAEAQAARDEAAAAGGTE